MILKSSVKCRSPLYNDVPSSYIFVIDGHQGNPKASYALVVVLRRKEWVAGVSIFVLISFEFE